MATNEKMSFLGLGGFANTGMGLDDIKFDGAVLGRGVDKNDIELVAMQKDLGLTLLDKRTKATITAFQDPQKAFKDYKKARMVIDIGAVNVYKSAGKQAEDAGLTKDIAMQYARKRAMAYHEAELELLNLSHPFADSPEGLVALASGAKRRDLLKKPEAPEQA